tara:strand:- start:116 stop:439 length:324 start_codon:yes stop_codon:yes gene_type:complete
LGGVDKLRTQAHLPVHYTPQVAKNCQRRLIDNTRATSLSDNITVEITANLSFKRMVFVQDHPPPTNNFTTPTIIKAAQRKTWALHMKICAAIINPKSQSLADPTGTR